MPDSLSVSQISCYLGCPRKYRFRYLERWPPERRSADMALGSAVHSAIAWWEEERIAGKLRTREEVMRTLRADWSAEVSTGLLDVQGDALGQLRVLGEQLVGVYLDRFQGELPAAVEQRFEVPICDPRSGRELPIPLVGYFDQVRRGGVGEIKTTSRKSSPSTWMLQLSAYSYATRVLTGERPLMRVIQLIKGKVPQVEVEELTVAAVQEAWFCEVASEVYEAIAAGAFFPSPSWMCGRCEYRGACRS